MSDRDAFRANRDAFKAKHHEQRLENATYTAAEVRVLAEAALRLGRKEAGDEIALRIEEWFPDPHEEDESCEDCSLVHQFAKLARTVASQPAPDATSGRTDPSRHQEAGSESQTLSNRLPGDPA